MELQIFYIQRPAGIDVLHSSSHLHHQCFRVPSPIHPVFLYQHNQNHIAEGGGGRKQQLPRSYPGYGATVYPTTNTRPNPSLQFVAAHPLILR